MAKEAVISVASSSFWFENLRAPKKKRIKLAVGDVRDPPSEFVLLFSGDASRESIAIPNDDMESFLFWYDDVSSGFFF